MRFGYRAILLRTNENLSGAYFAYCSIDSFYELQVLDGALGSCLHGLGGHGGVTYFIFSATSIHLLCTSAVFKLFLACTSIRF